jgi:hypothetical protein
LCDSLGHRSRFFTELASRQLSNAWPEASREEEPAFYVGARNATIRIRDIFSPLDENCSMDSEVTEFYVISRTGRFHAAGREVRKGDDTAHPRSRA